MCIRCGRSVESLVDGRLCPDCYLEVYGLGVMPSTITVTVCPRCGSFRYQGRWYPPPEDSGVESVAALIAQAMFKPAEHVEYYRVESVDIDYESERALIRVKGKLKGFVEEYTITYSSRLIVKRQLCPACFQKAAGTPNAIIQVRGYNGRLDPKDREAVEELIDSMEGVSDAILSVDEVKEGIDYKLLDQNIARHIAAKMRSKLAALVKESYKVVGRRSDGKRRARLTLSVRLPFFREGSLVEYNGSLAVVERIANGYVHVRRIGSTRTHRLRVEDAWKLLSRPSYEERRAIVAVVEPGWIHLQFTDRNYQYIELPRSQVKVEGRITPGSEVRVLSHKNIYYLLPIQH